MRIKAIRNKAMRTRADELDRIFLWILLSGGLIALLAYGLTSFFAQPTVETITTHASATPNSTGGAAKEINYQPRKSK